MTRMYNLCRILQHVVNSLEYLIGISPEIMAYGYHRGINECYTGTSSESSQIKEEHEQEEHVAFQLHKAVVRHDFRKIRLHRTLNEEMFVKLVYNTKQFCNFVIGSNIK